jgi:hypothetical protein
MMKMILTILILLFTVPAFAPDREALYIGRVEPVNPYERIINAVSRVESGNGTNLFNAKETAVGWFGIRPIRLKDYNQRSGSNVTLDQCYDYETGRRIFLYYASQFRPDDYEGISKDWNKSRTDKYWKKIKETFCKFNY